MILSAAALTSCGAVASVLNSSITDPFPWTYGGSGTMTYKGGIECSGPAELALTINDNGVTFTITSHKAVASLYGNYNSSSATVSGSAGNWRYSFSAGRTNKPSS